jgi:formylglycine-generating enzyme
MNLVAGSAPRVLQPRVVSVPEGWFLMGSDAGLDCERPVHRVWVNALEMAACQVTNAEYARFVVECGHAEPTEWKHASFAHPDQPVVGVSWFDAVAYCEWLSGRTSRRYRLPTEAEWERAARAGVEGNLYPWGNSPPQELPHYPNRWRTGPEPVGRYTPNAFGLFDMCENVHEWCVDWFDPAYYQVSPQRNPQGPAHGTRKASRGGSWRHHVKASKCHTRSSIPPEFRYADYGFRVARELLAHGTVEL